MAGVQNLEKVVQALVATVNAEEALRAVDYMAMMSEVLDADEAELDRLAAMVQALNLNDDALEMKAKALAQAGAKPLAFILKLVKIFYPKKP